jgi:ATP-dependent helicase/nuclease subunit B
MLCVTIGDDDSVTDIVRLGHSAPATNTSMNQPVQQELPKHLTLHIGDGDALVERVTHTTRQELVLAPVELYRRNIQRRLREAQTSKDGVQCTDPTAVATQLLAVDAQPPNPLDRIDRLSMIRSIHSDDEASIDSPAVPTDPQGIEQIRTEIENVTGFHPDRLDVLDTVADGLTPPLDADAADLIEAATTIERTLRRRTSKAVSQVESVRRATRRLLETDGEIFRQAYPDIDRISLVGVSSVAISYIDLLHAVLATVSVPVHIHFHAVTGTYLADRVSTLFDVSEPGTVVFSS